MPRSMTADRFTPASDDAADVDHLTPDRVLDIAYCYHVASEPETEDCPIGALAGRVVADFDRLCASARRGGRAWELLFTHQQVVVSLAKGITRRKKTFEDHLAVASQEREQQIRQLAEDGRRAGLLKACMRAALLGGLGYLLVGALAPGVRLGDRAQPGHASLAAAIGAVLLASFFKSWLMSKRVARIFERYELARSHAYMEYQEGALEEYLRAKRDAHRAWERYAGQPAPEWPGFETVILDDLRHYKSFHDERERLDSGPLDKAVDALHRWRGGKGEIRGDERP